MGATLLRTGDTPDRNGATLLRTGDTLELSGDTLERSGAGVRDEVAGIASSGKSFMRR